MTAAALARPAARRELWPLLVLLAVGLGLPALDAVVSGAWTIPHNDDWAYTRVALDLGRDGELVLVGWHQMLLLGHLLWAQPFLAALGDSVGALHVSNLVAGAAGVVATWVVARRLVGPVGALVCAGLLVLAPGYALEATQFMTDVTAFAAGAVSLAVGMAALARLAEGRRARGGLLLALAVAIGFAGVSSRESAFAAPAALLLVVLLRTRRRRDVPSRCSRRGSASCSSPPPPG